MINKIKAEIENIKEWKYTCENGHKWKSKYFPQGTYLYGKEGQTKCPLCKSPICKGEVYINDIKTKMGAVHVDWKGK